MKTCQACEEQYEAPTYWKRRVCPSCHKSKHYVDRCNTCGETKLKVSKECKKCVQNTSSAGSLNPNWKGGRIKHRKGYIELSVFNPQTQKREYVLEHRMIMQEHLGRSLTSYETVHHKNGIKDDNRIENLELWASIPQPSGQRVSDLVEYANHIAGLYGSDPSIYIEVE